jgi:hypothetical protein
LQLLAAVGGIGTIDDEETEMVVSDNGGDYEPIPTGMHRAILINYFDVGLQPGFQGDVARKKVVLLWELEARNDKTGKRFTITKTYTQSIGDKSNLGNDLSSWRGRPFTTEERKAFEMDNTKGKSCQINVMPKEPGSDKVKVAAVLPADKSRPYWAPETAKDYVPNFVTKMLDTRIEEQPKPKGTQTQAVTANDDFVDEIPF